MLVGTIWLLIGVVVGITITILFGKDDNDRDNFDKEWFDF